MSLGDGIAAASQKYNRAGLLWMQKSASLIELLRCDFVSMYDCAGPPGAGSYQARLITGGFFPSFNSRASGPYALAAGDAHWRGASAHEVPQQHRRAPEFRQWHGQMTDVAGAPPPRTILTPPPAFGFRGWIGWQKASLISCGCLAMPSPTLREPARRATWPPCARDLKHGKCTLTHNPVSMGSPA